ncbi:alpha/beta hydrolase [Leucobacter soli]|uniref:alpha/beta hydrolase n=1 Tax=Leucobacter soli TaxID=2812850 RepID=UPI00361F3EDB
MIGNLPGIPFAARDSANRRMLDFYDAHPSVLGDRGRVALRELQLIRDQGGDPQVSVVALDLTGSVPKVAVGYGDLDLADHLTWQVPGMESDADKALRTWDRASRNLYEEQQDLLERRNRGGLAGLVAFLSYDTPDLVDSLNEKGCSRSCRPAPVRIGSPTSSTAPGPPATAGSATRRDSGRPIRPPSAS